MEIAHHPRAVLVIGTIGAGKTVVAIEMGEILEESGIRSAILDLDWLGWVHRGPGQHVAVDDLIASNLGAIVPNFGAVGIHHYVLARSIRSVEQVAGLKDAFDGASLVVARLTASKETISNRLRNRDEGEVLKEHLVQAEHFAAEQAQADLADFDISNESGSVREVATEILLRLGWIG